VTTNYAQFDVGKQTTTNSSSYLNYFFTSEAPQPECDYLTGAQKWKAGVYDDACYKDTNSTNYTITIKSELRPEIFYPSGQGFIRPNPVPFAARIYDDCGLVAGASTTWTAYNGPNEYGCTNKTEANGWYNCTWPSANRPYGYYHLLFSAVKNYYPQNSTYKPNAYFLGTIPQLSDPKILNNHYLGGWGETYEFSVKLTDFDLNTNNVSVWKSFDGINWMLVDSKNVSNAVNQQIIFPVKFNCSDIGFNYFYFTSVDQFGYSTNTTVLNFTLEPDNVTLSVGLINTTVRRLGDQQALLNFTIYDDDYGRYASYASGKVNITLDYSNYSYSFDCTSNERGSCYIYYNPNYSSLAGVQKWIGLMNDGCYQPKETSPTSLTVIGQLNVSILSPHQSQILNRNQLAQLNSSVLDECFNEVQSASALWYNQTSYNIASGYNTTWSIPTYYELGPETIYINVSKTYYDGNSNVTSVYIYGWSGVALLQPASYSSYLAGTSINVRCKVSDLNTSQPLQTYYVKFYKNGTLQDTQLTNSDGEAFWLWQTLNENYGWYNITCAIENSASYYYNVSIEQGESIVEIKRPLIIQTISKDYPSVYREFMFFFSKKL
jgi:5-hydroxyisourate hydrolase-like protein (transthyretin family)